MLFLNIAVLGLRVWFGGCWWFISWEVTDGGVMPVCFFLSVELQVLLGSQLCWRVGCFWVHVFFTVPI
jgi:hypothetical protein